jgi:hypothetical protein
MIFEKLLVELKFWRNIHLAPCPTALGVPAAVGHDVRGAANGRQYWPVGPGLTPRPTTLGNPSVVGHGVRILTSWPAAAAPTYIREEIFSLALLKLTLISLAFFFSILVIWPTFQFPFGFMAQP